MNFKVGRAALAILVCALMVGTIPMSVIAAPFSGKVDREKVDSKTNNLGEAKVELFNYADIATSSSSPVVKSNGLKYTERNLNLPSKGTTTPVNATEPQYLYNKNDSVAGAKPDSALTNVQSQVQNGEMYNSKNWTGASNPVSQELDAAKQTVAQSMNIDMTGNINDSLVLTTGPAGAIPSVQTRANDSAPSLDRPAGLATITAQLKDAVMSLVQPSGAETITPIVSNATSDLNLPIGLSDNTIRGFNGVMTHVAPVGSHAIFPASANLTSTGTQPTGAPTSQSGTYYEGNISIDANQSGKPDSVLWLCLVDVAVSGTYDCLALSINDQVYNEGAPNDNTIDWGAPPGGNGNDEVIIATLDLILGNANAPTYTVSFDSDPTADESDVTIITKEWYTGNFLIDADGDLAVDDTVYYSVYDENSDGDFESVDLSVGDNTFGQGNITNSTLVTGDDEVLNGTSGSGGKGIYGPDDGGYTWTDKAKYNWIEINSTGTNLSLGDDDYAQPIELGFWFTYYGDKFNNTTICSNGWITFNDSWVNGFTWYPTGTPEENDGYYGSICLLCDDLDLSNYGALYYGTFGTAPHRYFVVEWWMVEDFAGGNPKTAEIILYETTNVIKFQWKNMTSSPLSVGIERNNETAGIGDGASGDLWIDPQNATDGTAYEFFPPGSAGVQTTDLKIGPYTYRMLRNPNPSIAPADLNLTNIDWFVDMIPFDGAEGGTASDRLNYAIADSNSDGMYEDIYFSFNKTFGSGTLNNNKVNLTDGEKLTWTGAPVTLTLGNNLTFSVEFDRNPVNDASDVRITALRWYAGSFIVDSDADGTVDDTYYYALTDHNSDGTYETIDLSFNDQTYGQGGTLNNNIVAAGDDERFLIKGNLRLGSDIIFTVSSSGAPTISTGDLVIENLYGYKGNMTFDANLDGKMNEQLYFVISDTDSNGIYETMDLSFDPIFGEGTLNDGLVTAKPYNDELIAHDADVQLGQGMNFNISFDKDPMNDNSDVRIKVKVWFEGMFKIDASNSGQLNDKLYYVLSDTNSDGFMDTMDLSLGDETFGQGTLNDGIVASGNDERLTKEGVVTIGTLQFSANFTGSPFGLAQDAWLKNTDVFKGDFEVDMGVTSTGQDVINYVILDADADGIYDTIDLSLGNDVFREDLSKDGYVDTDANDETMTAPGDVRIGPFVYALDFIWNPASTNKDVTLTSKQWYLGAFKLDSDGDGIANETAYFLLSDLDSNGLYDTMDISLDDKDFGQSTLDDGIIGIGNDERTVAPTNLTVGVQHMLVTFTPSPNQNIQDAFMKDVNWYTGTLEGSGWTLYYAICDKDSDGVFDTAELSTNAVFGEGDTADLYIQPSNDEIAVDGQMVIRGNYHYKILINTTMGGQFDIGLKGTEWRSGKWKVEGMSRAVAVDDTDSDGKFDTIHIDLNDDGSFDGPNDLTGGIAGFRGPLVLTYAVASSNEDGTLIEMAPINATVGGTNGWMVGTITLEGLTIGVAVSDKTADNKYETIDMDAGNGVIASTGLTEDNNRTALVKGTAYRALSVPASGAFVKVVAFPDAIAGSALDKSISESWFFGKVTESQVGMDLNDDGKMTGSLVGLVIDVATTGPLADRYVLYLDTNLNGDMGDETPLMLGTVFDMGSTQWKVDNIAGDRKEVGLMRIAGPVATATTGPDGTFSLSPPDGTYWVRASSQRSGWGYKLFEDTNQHHGYKVSGTGITDKEIVLSPSATSLSGVVTDMITGATLAGVTVEIYNSNGDKVVSTRSLNDGSYLLGVARNMVYDLVFSKDGYATDDGTKSNGTWNGVAAGAGRNDINVALMPVPSPDILTFLEPADGSVVSGDVMVKVKVTDLVKVDQVRLTVNDGITWIDMAPGTGNEFSVSWNSKLGPSGTYHLKARAINDAGLRVDKTLLLKVDNSGPTIVFTTAKQQYGNVQLVVKASDEFSDVKKVQVSVDGGPWQTMSKAGNEYIYIWNSGPADTGTHTYEVRATDSRDNVATYKSKVTVDNTWMVLLILMIVMLVVLVVVFIKKKKKAPVPPVKAKAPPKEGAK